jgi:dCTP deaminase
MSVLSDRDIRKEISSGNIVLHDPDRDCMCNIQNCSVDVTLGPYFCRNDHPIPYLNPWNSTHVSDYWGEIQTASVVGPEECKLFGMEIGEQFILLRPGESILGHTREFIGGKGCVTTMMKARSSMGRSGITICRDAGWGDCGYISRWTLEITNNSTSPIILPVGARVGQIIFFYMGTPEIPYSGKYQKGDTLDEIVSNWNPSMMLPKAYLDRK